MKKKLLYITIVLCFNFIVNSQVPPSYVNITQGINGMQDYTPKIIKFKSNYFGVSTASWPGIESEITLTKYDTLLNIISQKTLGFPNKSLISYIGNCIDVNNIDSSIYVSGLINQDYFGVRKLNGMLWKFNKNLDTLWHKSYKNTNDSTIVFYGMLMITDGIILYGQSAEFDINGDCFVMKVDFNGQELWRKTIQIPGQFGNFNKLIKTKDKCYIAVENILHYPIWGYSDIKVTKYDSLFNIKWQRILYSPFWDELGDVIILSDSNLVITQGYSVNQNTPPWGTNYNRQCINKLDVNTGSTIWQKKYGKISPYIQLYNIIETKSKKLLATGSMGTAYAIKPSGTYIGTALLLNQNGDSLNYQETFSDSISQNNYLFDIVSADNGYYCAGSSNVAIYTGTVLSSFEQQNWFVKADSNGFFNSNYVLDIVSINNSNQKIFFFPNPAQTILNISLPTNILENNLFFIIYDSMGKIVLKQTINHCKLKIDVSSLAKGFYITTIVNAENTVFTSKLLLQND